MPWGQEPASCLQLRQEEIQIHQGTQPGPSPTVCPNPQELLLLTAISPMAMVILSDGIGFCLSGKGMPAKGTVLAEAQR